MADILKVLPENLDPNKEYVVRVRSINGLGNASDWSEGVYVDTGQVTTGAGYISQSENDFAILNDQGELVFGAFTVQSQRFNLVKNPSFELDTVGWTNLAGSTLSRVATQAFFGSYAARVTPVVEGTTDIGMTLDTADYITVTELSNYTTSLYVYREYDPGEHGGELIDESLVKLTVNFYDNSNNLRGAVTASRPIQVPHNAWTRLLLPNVDIPTGVARIGLTVEYESTQSLTMTPNERLYVDGILVEQTDEVKGYFDGDTIDGTTSWTGTPHASTSEFENSTSSTVFIKGALTIGGALESTNYDGPDGGEIYADAGTRIDLSTGAFVSENFVIDDVGNVYIKEGITIGGYIPVGGAAADVNAGVTTIDGDSITSGTITGNEISAASQIFVGTGTDKIEINGGATEPSTYIRSGNTTYGAGDGFYMDASGKFSLGTQLTYEDGVLTIGGSPGGSEYVPIGGAAADINANTTTIDGGKITTGTLQADRIVAGTIEATQIKIGGLDSSAIFGSGVITADALASDAITSINYDAPDGGEVFADLGMAIDLSNGSFISKGLVIDNITGEVSIANLLLEDITAQGAVRIDAAGDVSLVSTGHPFQIGPDAGVNLAMDEDEIQGRNAGSASPFGINLSGGLVTIGGDGLETAGPVQGGRVEATSTNAVAPGGTEPPLAVGDIASLHLAVDNNTIQSFDSATPAILQLNQYGGDIVLGGETTAQSNLILDVAPTLASHAASKGYVDTQISDHEAALDPHPQYIQSADLSGYLPLSGGTMSGTISMDGNVIEMTDGYIALRGSGNNERLYVDTVDANQVVLKTLNTGELRTASGGEAIQLSWNDSTGVTTHNDLRVAGSFLYEPSTILTGGIAAPTSNDNEDKGLEFRYYEGTAKTGFLGWDNSTGKFVALTDTTNVGGVITGLKGEIDALIDFSNVLNFTGTVDTQYVRLDGATPMSGQLKAPSLAVLDLDATHYLTIDTGSNLTAPRTLNLNPGDADRTLTISADVTLDQGVSTTDSPTFVAPVASQASPSAANQLTRKDYVDGLITTHEGAVDPHPQYLTATEGDAAYVNVTGDTMTGNLVMDGAYIQATTAGANSYPLRLIQSAGATSAMIGSYGDGYLGWIGFRANSTRRFAFESNPGTDNGANFGLYHYDAAGTNVRTVWTSSYASGSPIFNVNGILRAALAPVGSTDVVRKQELDDHVAAVDPHPQYLTSSDADGLFLTPAEGDAAYVNITGDTMTGLLKAPEFEIDSASSAKQITALSVQQPTQFYSQGLVFPQFVSIEFFDYNLATPAWVAWPEITSEIALSLFDGDPQTMNAAGTYNRYIPADYDHRTWRVTITNVYLLGGPLYVLLPYNGTTTYKNTSFKYERSYDYPNVWETMKDTTLYGEGTFRVPVALSSGPTMYWRFTFDTPTQVIGENKNVYRIWGDTHYPHRRGSWDFAPRAQNGENVVAFNRDLAPARPNWTGGPSVGTALNRFGEGHFQFVYGYNQPTDNVHLTRKDYVDSTTVSISGDTMTGDLNLNGNDLVLNDGILYLRSDVNDHQILWESDQTVIQSTSTGVLRTTSGGNKDVLTWNAVNGVDIDGDLLVTGDVTVQGTTTTIESTVVTIEDPIITLGGATPPSVDDGKDRGVEFRYYDTEARTGFLGWDNGTNKFVALTNTTNTSEVITGTVTEINALVDFGNILNWTGTLDNRYVNTTGDTMTGNLTLSNGADLVFFDNNGTYPTTAGKFVWDLNTDGASIEAIQPSTDAIDFVFKITDNALSNSRYLFWVDDYLGSAGDKYPIVALGTGDVYMGVSSTGADQPDMADYGLLVGVGTNISYHRGILRVDSAPVDGTDVVRKTELDTKVSKSGDTMTGLLVLDNLGVQLDPTNKLELTLGTDGPEVYSRGVTSTNEVHNIWNAGATRWVFVPAPSGTADNAKEFSYDFTTSRWVFETPLTIAEPSLNTDAATKGYVDTEILSIDGDITNHIGDTTDAHDASAISFVPPAVPPLNVFLTATEVQTAITQVATEVDGRISAGDTDAIIAALNAWTSGDTINNSDIFSAEVIVADAIAAGAIVASKIAAGVINASHIEANSFTGNEFNAKSVIRIGESGEIVIQGTDNPLTTSIDARGLNPVRAYDEWVETQAPSAVLPLDGNFTDRSGATAKRVQGPAVWFGGTEANSISVPTLDYGDSLDVRWCWTPNGGTTTSPQVLFGPWGGGLTRGWYIRRDTNTDNDLRLYFTYDGDNVNATECVFTSTPTIPTDAPSWWRVTLDATTTSAVANLYQSLDGGDTWTLIQSLPKTTTVAGIYNSPDQTYIADFGAAAWPAQYALHYLSVQGDAVLFEFDAATDITSDSAATSLTSTSGHTLTVNRAANNDSAPVTTLIPEGTYNWVDTAPHVLSADWVEGDFGPLYIPNIPFPRRGLVSRVNTTASPLGTINNSNSGVSFVLHIPGDYTGPTPYGFYSDGGVTALGGGGIYIDGLTLVANRWDATDTVHSHIEYTLPGPGTYAVGYLSELGIGGMHALFVNGNMVANTTHPIAPVTISGSARVGGYYGRTGVDGSSTLGDLPMDGSGLVIGEFAITDSAPDNTWFDEYYTNLFKGFATGDGFHIDASGRFSVGTSFKWDGSRYLDVGDGFRWDDSLGKLTIGSAANANPLEDFDGVWEARLGDDAGIPNTGTAGTALNATNSGLVRVEGPAVWTPQDGTNAGLSIPSPLGDALYLNRKLWFELDFTPTETSAAALRFGFAKAGLGSAGTTGRAYDFYVGTGQFRYSPDGTNMPGISMFGTVTLTAGVRTQFKFWFDPTTGDWESFRDGVAYSSGSIGPVTVHDSSEPLSFFGRSQTDSQGGIWHGFRAWDDNGTIVQFDPENVTDPVGPITLTSGQTATPLRDTTGPVTTLVPEDKVVYINPDDSTSANNLAIPDNSLFDAGYTEDIVMAWMGHIGNVTTTFPKLFSSGQSDTANFYQVYTNPTTGSLNIELRTTGEANSYNTVNWNTAYANRQLVVFGVINRNTQTFSVRAYGEEGIILQAPGQGVDISDHDPIAPIGIGKLLDRLPGSFSAAAFRKGVGVAPSDAEMLEIADYLLNKPYLGAGSSIESNNFYKAPTSFFSDLGSRWDLTTGEIVTPQLAISASDGSARFAGELIAPSGDIGGWDIVGNTLTSGDMVLDAGSGQISVNNTGQISVGEAANKITLNATSTDTTTYIGANATSYNQAGSGMYADASGRFSLGDKLTWDGSTLSIDGSIDATSGTIGGLTVESTKIYVGTGDFNNINTPFYVDNTGQFSLEDQLSWDGTTLTIAGDAVIDGDAIVSGSITTSKLDVQKEGDNLIENGRFAAPVEDTWLFSEGNSVSTNRTRVLDADGQYYLAINYNNDNTAWGSIPFPFKPGAEYVLTYDIMHTTGVGIHYARVNFSEDFQTQITSGTRDSYSGGPGADQLSPSGEAVLNNTILTWTTKEHTWTAPANCNWGSFTFYLWTGSSGELRVRNVKVVERISSVRIEDGAVTADKVSTDAIVSKTYSYTSGNFSDSGTYFNLATTGYIRSQNFAIDTAGNAYFKGDITGASGTFSGTLSGATISGGTISGTTITGGTITIGSGESVFKADSNGIYLGNETFANAEFSVTPAGVLKATSGTIGGWDITTSQLQSTSDLVVLDSAGSVTLGSATNAILLAGTGTSNSTVIRNSGTGGMTGYGSGTGFWLDASGRIYLGSSTGNHISFDGTDLVVNADNFDIDAAGNVSMSGTVTASAGSIGGLTIDTTKIYVGTGDFNNANTGFYVDNTGQFSLKDQLSWDGTTLTIGGTPGSALGTLVDNRSAIVENFSSGSDGYQAPLPIGASLVTDGTSEIGGTHLRLERDLALYPGVGIPAPIVLDRTYKISVTARVPTGVSAQNLYVRGEFGTIPDTYWIVKLVSIDGTAGEWNVYTFTLAPSATAARAVGTVDFTVPTRWWFQHSGSQTAGDDIEIDAILIEEMSEIFTVGTTTIDGGNITADSVTATQIDADTITATEIAGNTITASEIATNTITATEIATETITAAEIASGTITASRLNVVREGANLVTAGSFGGSTVTQEDWCAWTYATTPAPWTIAPSAESARGGSTVIIDSGINDGIVSRAFPVEAGKTYSLRVRERWAAGTGIIYAGVYSTPTKPANGFVDTNNRVQPTGGWGENYVLHNGESKAAGSGGTGAWIESEVIWTAPDDASGQHSWASIVFLNYSSSDTTYEIDWVELVPQIIGVQIANDTITAGNIVANTITADEIAAGTITGTELNATTSITVGTDVGGTWNIEGTASELTTAIYTTGATWANDTGIWIDASGRMRLGASFDWDGSTLTIDGGGTFSGDISAASGTFTGDLSGSTITGGAISGGTIDIGGADATSFHVDTNGNMWLGNAVFGSAPFSVSSAGALTATGVDVTGTVSATGGAIGGWTVNPSSLTSPSGNIVLDNDNSEIKVGSGASSIWIEGTGTNTSSAIRAGQTGFDTGTGFWLDASGRFSIGNSAANKLTWDGTTLSITGTLASVDGNFTGTVSGGAISGGVIDIGGADSTSFHVDSDGQMWLGDAAYATAPFRVSSEGAIRAESGLVGGWNLNDSELYSDNNDIILDPAGAITVGASYGSQITLDSATGTNNSTYDRLAAFDGFWLASEGDISAIPNLGSKGSSMDAAVNAGLDRVEGPAIWFAATPNAVTPTVFTDPCFASLPFNITMRVDETAITEGAGAIISCLNGSDENGYEFYFNGSGVLSAYHGNGTTLVTQAMSAAWDPAYEFIGIEISEVSSNTSYDIYRSKDGVSWEFVQNRTLGGVMAGSTHGMTFGKAGDFGGRYLERGSIRSVEIRNGASLGEGSLQKGSLTSNIIASLDPDATTFDAFGANYTVTRGTTGPATTVVPSGVEYLNTNLSSVYNVVPAGIDRTLGTTKDLIMIAKFREGAAVATWNSSPASTGVQQAGGVSIRKGNGNHSMVAWAMDYDTSAQRNTSGITIPLNIPVVAILTLNRTTDTMTIRAFTESGQISSTLSAAVADADNFSPVGGGFASGQGMGAWGSLAVISGVGVASNYNDADLAEFASYLLSNPVASQTSGSASIRVGGTGGFNQRNDTIYLSEDKFSIGKDKFRWDGTNLNIGSDFTYFGDTNVLEIDGGTLTTGTVNADSINVLPTGNNLVLGGDMEGTTPEWYADRGGGHVFGFTTSDKVTGGQSLSFTTGGFDSSITSRKFPVVESTDYVFKFWIKSDDAGSGSVYVRIAWSDVDPGTEANLFTNRDGYVDVSYENVDMGTITSWTYVEREFTMPATAKWASVTVLHWSDTGASTIYLDDVNVSEVVTGISIADGAITGEKINASSDITIGTNGTYQIRLIGDATQAGTKLYGGNNNGTWNNGTGFYMDATGDFSLGGGLSWDASAQTLSIGSDFSYNANTTTLDIDGTSITDGTITTAKIDAEQITTSLLSLDAISSTTFTWNGTDRFSTAGTRFILDDLQNPGDIVSEEFRIDGGQAFFSGVVTETAYIGNSSNGWSITSTTINSSTTDAIVLDAANDRIRIGTGSSRIGLDYNATAADRKIYIGNGNYNATDTGFYADASGRFSLKDKLVFDGTNLTINDGQLKSAGYSGVTDGSTFSTNGTNINFANDSFTSEKFRIEATTGDVEFQGDITGGEITSANYLDIPTSTTFTGTATPPSGWYEGSASNIVEVRGDYTNGLLIRPGDTIVVTDGDGVGTPHSNTIVGIGDANPNGIYGITTEIYLEPTNPAPAVTWPSPGFGDAGLTGVVTHNAPYAQQGMQIDLANGTLQTASLYIDGTTLNLQGTLTTDQLDLINQNGIKKVEFIDTEIRFKGSAPTAEYSTYLTWQQGALAMTYDDGGTNSPVGTFTTLDNIGVEGPSITYIADFAAYQSNNTTGASFAKLGEDGLFVDSHDSSEAVLIGNGRVRVEAGSAGNPSLFFRVDTDTGIYRSGTNQLSVSTGGGARASFNSNGIETAYDVEARNTSTVITMGDWPSTTAWRAVTSDNGYALLGHSSSTSPIYYRSDSAGYTYLGTNNANRLTVQNDSISVAAYTFAGSLTGQNGTSIQYGGFGIFFTFTSNEWRKERIEEVDYDYTLEVIDQLRPVNYYDKYLGEGEEDPEAKEYREADKHWGFIAEEVFAIDDGHLATIDYKAALEDDVLQPNGWSEHAMATVAVAGVKALKAKIETLEAENLAKDAKINDLESQLLALAERVSALEV